MNPFISELVRSGRIVSGGKIVDTSEAFSLEGGQPFALFLKKNGSEETVQVLNVTLLANEAASDFPFLVEHWSEAMITSLNSVDGEVSGYDIYWGAGGDVATE